MAADNLDQPATKRDLLELRGEFLAFREDVRRELHDLRIMLEAYNVRLDAYWAASDRVQRLAFALLITAWAGILGTVITVLVRR